MKKKGNAKENVTAVLSRDERGREKRKGEKIGNRICVARRGEGGRKRI